MSRDYYYSEGRRPYLWAVVGAVALYTVAGFFLLPPILKAQLEKRLSAGLGRTVTVAKVRTNPYALSLTVEGFDIRDAEARESFLRWKRLYVNFEALASLGGDWVLNKVEVDGFHAAVTVNPEGALNFSDILETIERARKSDLPDEPSAEPKPGRPVRIGLLQITEAGVDFADESLATPFRTTVGPLTFTVKDFRTAHGDSDAPYHFEAVTETGERLVWAGEIGAIPFQSKGELRLEAIQLAKYAPYLKTRLRAQFAEGTLSASGRYEINLDEKSRTLKVTDGAVQLRGLKMRAGAEGPLAVEIPELDLAGIYADGVTLKTTIASVRLANGHVRGVRNERGEVDLVTMWQPPASASAAGVVAPVTNAVAGTPSSSGGATKPDVRVDEIAVKDFRIDFEDRAAARPAKIVLSGVQFGLKDFSLRDGAAMPVDLALALAPGGTLKVAGSVVLAPTLNTELQVTATSLALAPLSPYFETALNARVEKGRVAAKLAVHAEMPDAGAAKLAVHGDVTVEEFSLVDGARGEEVVRFASLALANLQASTGPATAVSLDEIKLTAPRVRVIMNADRTLNLAALVKPNAGAPASAAEVVQAPPSGAEPKIAIKQVTIADGEFRWLDRSVQPEVQMALGQFGGTIAGLSSDNFARGEVALRGSVDGSGPVAITGKLDPLGATKAVDLTLDFKNVDLVPLSPYVGKYAGYELARGKLVLDVKFGLKDRALDANNVVTLNQFTFGPAVNSADATKLPVRLGVALLKDRSGKIVIDVPVQGNLDDPNFRVGRVVLRVLTNLLTKAATSPFSMLGSMFGGGGEELAFQEFSAGSAELQPEGIKKLETLATALRNRPALSLALEGSFNRETDVRALKQVAWEQLVVRTAHAQRREAGAEPAAVDAETVTPDERAAVVKKLFAEAFPHGVGELAAQPTAPAEPPPAVEPAPAEPKRGFFRRMWNVVTFRGNRDQREAQRTTEAHAEAQAKAVEAVRANPSEVALEVMEVLLVDAQKIGDDELRGLARAREQQVRDYFVTVGKIEAERLFLTKGEAAGASGKGARVFLSLQ